jgi:hypothetical protein
MHGKTSSLKDAAFALFMNAQLETIHRYIDAQRALGDTRDENTLAMLWIQLYAESFRNNWTDADNSSQPRT